MKLMKALSMMQFAQNIYLHALIKLECNNVQIFYTFNF